MGHIATVTAVYPGVWGVTQVLTGTLSDWLGRKWLSAAGVWVQAGAIFPLVAGRTFWAWLAAVVLPGLGTARSPEFREASKSWRRRRHAWRR